jgi:hypothetical protein
MKHTLIFLLGFWGQCGFAQDTGTDMFDQFVGFSTSVGAGHLAQTGQPDLWGQTFGIGGAMRLGDDDERPVFLEFGWSTLQGDSQSRNTQSLAAQTPFVFRTWVSPSGDLSVNAFTDETGAHATSIITLTDPQGGEASISSTTFSPPGGQTSVFAFTPTETGGLYTSVVTDGTGGIASAVGTIFDETGAVIMGDGNAGATQVTTSRSDNVDFNDGSLQLSMIMPLDNGWTSVPRGGLVVQSLDRSTILTQTIDIDDGFAADPPAPTLSVVQNADMHTDLTGVSFGVGLSRQLWDKWRFSFGADVGAAQSRSRFSSRERVQLNGFDAQAIAGPYDHDDNIVRMGRISFGVSRPLPQGGVLSISLYSEAISGMPYLDRMDVAAVSPVVSGDDNETNLTVVGETNQELQIRYGDLHNTGVSVALVWMF